MNRHSSPHCGRNARERSHNEKSSLKNDAYRCSWQCSKSIYCQLEEKQIVTVRHSLPCFLVPQRECRRWRQQDWWQDYSNNSFSCKCQPVKTAINHSRMPKDISHSTIWSQFPPQSLWYISLVDFHVDFFLLIAVLTTDKLGSTGGIKVDTDKSMLHIKSSVCACVHTSEYNRAPLFSPAATQKRRVLSCRTVLATLRD